MNPSPAIGGPCPKCGQPNLFHAGGACLRRTHDDFVLELFQTLREPPLMTTTATPLSHSHQVALDAAFLHRHDDEILALQWIVPRRSAPRVVDMLVAAGGGAWVPPGELDRRHRRWHPLSR